MSLREWILGRDINGRLKIINEYKCSKKQEGNGKMKLKTGDKARVKKTLKVGKNYGDYYFNSNMAELIGQIVTIGYVGDCYYYLEEDKNEYAWSDEMLTKVKNTSTSESSTTSVNIDLEDLIEVFTNKMNENNLAFNNIEKSIEKNIQKLTKEINKNSLYDEAIHEQVMKKVKEIPVEDFKQEIHKDIDRYIKTNFSTVPKKIEIKQDTFIKQMEGLFHKNFEQILKIVDKGVPLMLTGPAGAGKNHTLEQVAEALELDFYFTNAVTQEYKLTGFIDANGVYQETQFYKAFKDGGLFFLDEVDASCPESLIILNSAIANGYFDFPNGRINANKKFRVVCAGNTYGTGADMVYVGRNVLDGATLDRFATMDFDYDEDIEKQLAYDDELYNFIVDLRKAIKEASLRYIVSMRATINATKLLEIEMPKEYILKSAIIKNMQIDDLNVIIKKMNDRNKWFSLLEDYVNDRN